MDSVGVIGQVLPTLAVYLDVRSLGNLIASSHALWSSKDCGRSSKPLWMDAFHRQWPNDSNCGPLYPPTKEGEGEGEGEGTAPKDWTRAGEWFERRFQKSRDWYANCRSRWAYSASVDDAINRGARGFVAAADAEDDGSVCKSEPHTARLVFEGASLPATSLLMHWRFIGTAREKPVIKIDVPYEVLSTVADDLITRLMDAFLTVTRPDQVCCSIDQEHREDFFFPHVLQRGSGHVEPSKYNPESVVDCNGPRSFISDGETSVTCSADGTFGVEIVTWDTPCRVTIWGAPLVEIFDQRPPRLFHVARVERSDTVHASDRRGPKQKFVQMAARAFGAASNGARKWKMTIS